MPTKDILKTSKEEMEKAIHWLEDAFKIIRTGRATPALLDHIRVEYYGDKTPLNALATISVPEPRQLLIKPFDPNCAKDIEKAILASELGLTPSNEGQVIRLSIPPLSEERRKGIAAQVKDKAEHARVTIRNIRRDRNKDVDNAHKKDKTITEDLVHQVKDEIQDQTKKYEEKIEQICKKKSEEVMEI